MAKFTTSTIKELVRSYISSEFSFLAKKAVISVKMSTVSSILLELNKKGAKTPDDIALLSCLKQSLSEKGGSFETRFRKLHAMFFAVTELGLGETAKKRYRLVLDAASGDPKHPFWKFVNNDHKVLFEHI